MEFVCLFFTFHQVYSYQVHCFPYLALWDCICSYHDWSNGEQTVLDGQISGDFLRERELALVQHWKVSLPQGDLQINDQGRRLSAGLHASCPIHRQTCQGAFPLGNLGDIYGVFPSLLPPTYWLRAPLLTGWMTEGDRSMARGPGWVWWVEVLKIIFPSYLGRLHRDMVCSLVAMAPTLQPTTIPAAAGH